jgi:hypothetical protein
VTGSAAFLLDFNTSLAERLPVGGLLVATATFVLLFLMTGSVLVPAKALVMNVLSLGASFGALVLVFQEGWLAGPLGVEPADGLQTWVPVLVFVFAFGLSMDYEVFLLSRIKELVDEGHDSDTAVALGPAAQRPHHHVGGAAARHRLRRLRGRRHGGHHPAGPGDGGGHRGRRDARALPARARDDDAAGARQLVGARAAAAAARAVRGLRARPGGRPARAPPGGGGAGPPLRSGTDLAAEGHTRGTGARSLEGCTSPLSGPPQRSWSPPLTTPSPAARCGVRCCAAGRPTALPPGSVSTTSSGSPTCRRWATRASSARSSRSCCRSCRPRQRLTVPRGTPARFPAWAGMAGTDWDFRWLPEPPPHQRGEERVEPVDDEIAVKELLAASSSRASVQPGDAAARRWVGVRDAAGTLLACAADTSSATGVGHLSSIAVIPEARGQGLGKGGHRRADPPAVRAGARHRQPRACTPTTPRAGRSTTRWASATSTPFTSGPLVVRGRW